MSRYLTLVVRLADNADARLVFDQVERINGVALSASSWSHALDARDILASGIERKQTECDRLREALAECVCALEVCGKDFRAMEIGRAVLAKHSNPVQCACGDIYQANSYGASFMAANNGTCPNCDAAALSAGEKE